MPESTEDLVALLQLETIEVDLYRGRQPATALQRVFGGQVLGQALAAASRTVPGDRVTHSLHAYFLRPGDPAVPIIYDVERLREGRSFSACRVAARQHGRPIFFLSASFQVREPGPDQQVPAPPMSRPDSYPSLGEHLLRRPLPFATDPDEEFAALDVRHAGASYPESDLYDPMHPAVARIWMRTAGRLPDDPVLHRCVLAYMSDLSLLGASLVPHVFESPKDEVQWASLDHAMWFHRPFRADEWLLYDQVSPSASGARGLSVGRIFNEHGVLVATAMQEGLVRPRTR
jgi:acyl-CoA thioesterase II